MQNVIAYTWGSALNFAFVYTDGSSREIVQRDGFLAHYNKYTWWYVVVQAFMGLSVSFIFKYARHRQPSSPLHTQPMIPPRLAHTQSPSLAPLHI